MELQGVCWGVLYWQLGIQEQSPFCEFEGLSLLGYPIKYYLILLVATENLPTLGLFGNDCVQYLQFEILVYVLVSVLLFWKLPCPAFLSLVSY